MQVTKESRILLWRVHIWVDLFEANNFYLSTLFVINFVFVDCVVRKKPKNILTYHFLPNDYLVSLLDTCSLTHRSFLVTKTRIHIHECMCEYKCTYIHKYTYIHKIYIHVEHTNCVYYYTRKSASFRFKLKFKRGYTLLKQIIMFKVENVN